MKPLQRYLALLNILCTVVYFALPRGAVAAPAATEVTPLTTPASSVAKVQIAERILDTIHLKENLFEGVERMIQMQLKQVPELAPLQATVREQYSKFMSYDAMKGDFIKFYTEEFTEEELQKILEFYQTDAGQRILKKMPGLLARQSSTMVARVQKHMPEVQEKLRAELEKIQAKNAKAETGKVAAEPAAKPTTKH